MRVIKVNGWGEVPSNYTGIIEFPGATTYWILNGNYHREDGPAREYSVGHKEWWRKGAVIFLLPSKFQPFILVEEFMGKEGEEQIKILNEQGICVWPNLPGLKECTDNWEKK